MANLDAKGIAYITFDAKARAVELVNVESVIAAYSMRIRVAFDRGMTKDAALLSKYNYDIQTSTPGAVTPAITSIEAENISQPTFVDLIISEMTDGATYEVEVNPNGPIDINGDPIDPDNNTGSVTGVGIRPTIESVTAVGPNRVDVKFSEAMKDNADIRDASNYSFDNGLHVLSVLDFDYDTVKLITDTQSPGIVYNLTVLA
jgi:hypothetical protein